MIIYFQNEVHILDWTRYFKVLKFSRASVDFCMISCKICMQYLVFDKLFDAVCHLWQSIYGFAFLACAITKLLQN